MVRLCLPVEEWPVLDQETWRAAHRRGGLLDDDGLAADWAPATSEIIAGGYGRFLSFLIEIEELDSATPPAARITRPRVKAYIEHLRRRNHSSTVAATFGNWWKPPGSWRPIKTATSGRVYGV